MDAQEMLLNVNYFSILFTSILSTLFMLFFQATSTKAQQLQSERAKQEIINEIRGQFSANSKQK